MGTIRKIRGLNLLIPLVCSRVVYSKSNLAWNKQGRKTAPSEASMPPVLSPQAITGGGRFSLTMTLDKYLIEKIWIDNLENQWAQAFGYEPYAIVDTKKEAQDFCRQGRKYTPKDSWVLGIERESAPEFRYKKLPYFSSPKKNTHKKYKYKNYDD